MIRLVAKPFRHISRMEQMLSHPDAGIPKPLGLNRDGDQIVWILDALIVWNAETDFHEAVLHHP